MIRENIITITYTTFIVFLIVLASSGSLAIIYFLIAGVPFADKIAHFFLMGFLAFFVNMSLKYRAVKFLGIPILLGSTIVLFFVALEELSQRNNIHRTFDWYDLVADLAGIIIIPWLFQKYWEK